MKKLIISIILLGVVTLAQAQSAAWFHTSADAKTYALSNKVPILLIFSGSDWCKPCMMLKADILHSEAFKAYYPTKMAILYLDFPMQAKNKLPADLKKQNELLAEKYNKSGAFPSMILIDTDGKILGNLKYNNQTPAVFIDQCNALLSSVKGL